jgi:hypothetical protein
MTSGAGLAGVCCATLDETSTAATAITAPKADTVFQIMLNSFDE